MIALICAFGPMVHERYSFPAVLLLLLGYIECRDKRVLIGATVLSATLFLNEILVLQVRARAGQLRPPAVLGGLDQHPRGPSSTS